MKIPLTIGLLFLFACTSASNESIKIGFVGALTGDAATYGTDDKNGVLLALEDINAQGINGKQLEVIFEDGKCSGKDAATVVQKLIQSDKVKVILGGSCSGETLAMAPVTESNKIILFTSLASNPSIAKAGDFVFRNLLSDSFAGSHIAEIVAKKHKNVAIISENTDYAQGLRTVFKEKSQELGLNIVADEVFDPGTTDFKTLLSKIKQSSPEAVFIDPQTDGTAGVLLKQIKEQGVQGQAFMAWFGGSKVVEEQAKEFSEGLIWNDLPEVSPNNKKAQDVLARHEKTFGTKPTFPVWMLLSYDRTRIVAEALKKCGENTECIRDYLYDTGFDGAAGRMSFNDDGEVVGFSMQGYVRKDGKVVRYEG